MSKIEDLTMGVRVKEDSKYITVSFNSEYFEDDSDYVKLMFLNYLKISCEQEEKFFKFEDEKLDSFFKLSNEALLLKRLIEENDLSEDFKSSLNIINKQIKYMSKIFAPLECLNFIRTFINDSKEWGMKIDEKMPDFTQENFQIKISDLNFLKSHNKDGVSREVVGNVVEYYNCQYAKKNDKSYKKLFRLNMDIYEACFDEELGIHPYLKKTNNVSWELFKSKMMIGQTATSEQEICEFFIRLNEVNNKYLNLDNKKIQKMKR